MIRFFIVFKFKKEEDVKEKVLTLITVVCLGVLLGVGIVSTQSKGPVLKSVLEKQNLVISSLRNIQQKTDLIYAKVQDSRPTVIQPDQTALEARIAKLEEQVGKILAIIPPEVLEGGGQAQGQNMPQEPSMDTVHELPLGYSPVMGNRAAPITITTFTDFQCPYCAGIHKPILEVLAKYPNQVKYVIKNFPLSFHENARSAAKAALAANFQGKYSEMTSAILENQSQLSEEKYKELAKNIGLDVDKFMKDYKEQDAKFEQVIQADIDLANEVGVRGTPTIFLDGKLTNSRDFNSFKREIDAILNQP